MNKSSVVIVILNFGDPKDTLDLYATLSTFPVKVIVVDNYSSNETVELLKSKVEDKYLLLNASNNGYGPGNNIGLKFGFEDLKADICIAMNSDIQLKEFKLQELFDDIDLRRPQLFSGKVLEDGLDIGINEFNPKTFKSLHLDKVPTCYENKPIYPAGSLWGMNSKMWCKNGGFTEDYFLYFEELEFIYRYMCKYDHFPEVVKTNAFNVIHLQGGSTGVSKDLNKRSLLSEYYSARNRVKFADSNKLLFNALLYNTQLLVHRLIKFKFHLAAEIIKATIRGLR